MDKIQISLEEFLDSNLKDLKESPTDLMKDYVVGELSIITKLLNDHKANKRDKIIDKILNELD